MTTHHYDPHQPAFTDALDHLEPQLMAIPPEKLEPVRHDIPTIVVAVLGLVGLPRYREQVRVEIGQDAAKQFDALPEAALAAGNAHAAYLVRLTDGDAGAMIEELSQERRVLLAEARALVARGKLDASRLAQLEGGTGQKALCFDVLQLVSAFRSEWPAIASSTPVKLAELDHVEALATEVATALGASDTVSTSRAVELRQRAYTHLVHTYSEVRRAIAFIRWAADDADQIAPSLSAGRQRREPTDDEVPTPVVHA